MSSLLYINIFIMVYIINASNKYGKKIHQIRSCIYLRFSRQKILECEVPTGCLSSIGSRLPSLLVIRAGPGHCGAMCEMTNQEFFF
jgi:hypothetical protein